MSRFDVFELGNSNNPIFNISNNQNDHKACLKDLWTTDPRDDKKRIEEIKGGLFKDSYRWILEHSKYQQWRDDTQRPLLWIKGDPGKGKTMLLCGIIDELSGDKDAAALFSYFFCQTTDPRLNNATAVLRGLICLLIDQQPSLISHVQKRYDQGSKNPFEGVNAWVALSLVFEKILEDPILQSSTYLIIDALDECETDLPQLLKLIVQSASRFPCVKWIVSSRNKPDIEAQLRLDHTQVRLSLELNEKHVSRAIEIFIDFRVSRLPNLTDDSALQEIVRGQIYAKATGTFLWVAFVLVELERVESWDVLNVLREIPPGLKPLYRRMIEQIDQLQRRDPEFCRYVLSTMILAYRPLHLVELAALSSLPEQISKSPDHTARVVRKCGSFLTIREGIVFFIHQSAKDFLFEDAYDKFFPAESEAYHYTIFSRSLQVMSAVLRRDVYSLRAPGISIDQVKQPNPDPLAAVRYSCLYWVDHLLDCQTREDTIKDLKDCGLVYNFLRQYFLHWLEALSLIKCMSDGVIMIKKLENLQFDESPNLFAFTYDARRFAVYNRPIIEQAPLQAYCSALVFAPEKSIIRETFEKCIPPWIQRKPRVETHWNAMLQILEGHTDVVTSVAFSSDGKQIVSGSDDGTVRLWDAATGHQVLPILEGHISGVSSVAFSPDGTQIVSGSSDETVRLWDAATGQQALPALEGHILWVSSVAFSPDGTQIVSGSYDKTIRLWDAATGQQILSILKGNISGVSSVAFSPDGTQIVSGSSDHTVRLWDAATGKQVRPALAGHTSWVSSVAFSPDGTQIVSGSSDHTVRLWDAATGQRVRPILEGHTDIVGSVAFSANGKQIVSGSRDKTIRLWDAATGKQVRPALAGHTSWVSSVAFSPDGTQIVSGSDDETIRLWDAATGQQIRPTLAGHTDMVTSLAFSADGTQIVSGSEDKTIRLWDAATEQQIRPTLVGHTSRVTSVAFSPDGTQIVSGSRDETVRLWDAATGQQVRPALAGPTNWASSVASSLTFSPDGKHIPTLHVINYWLAEGTASFLWLPTGYRATSIAVWGRIIVLGHKSGRISFLQIQQGPKLVT
ncbi:WD40-repeat-containing domain protein [Leptodontidium sp. MPI-SDFR-AT-0119]|nr:WD40-repeat-containing domain protein [Leptodontidium sp. MPI-SDFR-AT-0119]